MGKSRMGSHTAMEGQTKTISLTIVRHGQTDANKNKILHGWRTNIPVNSFGIKQAEAAGSALKDEKYDQAYSSDLQRAIKTCQLILEENQMSDISSENIKQDQRIKERKIGENGQSVKNRAKEFLSSVCENSKNGERILIVSHRSLIRRLFQSMLHEMNCILPKDMDILPKLHSGNTCISRFKIEISNENNSIETIQCEELFNEAHLSDLYGLK